MMTLLKVNTQIFKLLKLGMLHSTFENSPMGVSALPSLFALHIIINSKRALQKSCCLLCIIISPWRVRSQLTPEEHFGKKSKRRVKL